MSTKDALQGRGSPTFHPKISLLVWLIVHYVAICKKMLSVCVCVLLLSCLVRGVGLESMRDVQGIRQHLITHFGDKCI